MDIKPTVTINLTKDEISEIVSDWLLTSNGYKVSDEDKEKIQYNIETRSEGGGMFEYDVTEFTGMTIKLKSGFKEYNI